MDAMTIDSADGFRQAVVAGVTEAVRLRARRLVLVDPDFDQWPLDDRALLQALTDFVRLPARQVLLLASRFEHVQRESPRFVRWRQTWAHAIDARRPVDVEVQLPCALIADQALMLEVLDKVHWRARLLVADARIVVQAQAVDVLAQRTEPAFGAHTLGL